MNLLDKKSSFIIALLGLPLLYLPKFNLYQFSGETAGIRIDDFLLFGICIVLGWAHFVLNRKMHQIEFWILGILGISLISYTMNQFLIALGILPAHTNAKILYCFRIFEYFIFFYIGLFSAKFLSARRVIFVFFLWNILVMSLQKLGITGSIVAGSYVPVTTYRVYGIASFPSEMGALINILFCFLLFGKKNTKPTFLGYNFSNLKSSIFRNTDYLLFLVCMVFIIFTGSRIAIPALLFPFLYKIRHQFNLHSPNKSLLTLLLLIGMVTICTYTIFNTRSIFERSIKLFSFNNLNLISHTWENIILSHTPLEGMSIKTGSFDMSWWIRIQKWCYALKTYWLHPECYLQGVGPGFAMPALDGGYIRILTEYGLIGSLTFFQLFRWIWKQSEQLKWMLIAFGFNMIFFDIFMAYKPMSLLFLATGFTCYQNEKQTLSNNQYQQPVGKQINPITQPLHI